MKCKRCGKLLKSEKSIQLGFGVCCYKHYKLNSKKTLFEKWN